MKDSDHLTSSDIAAYAAKTLSSDEHRLVGVHLLGCADCRTQMPIPTTEDFLKALLDESDEPERGDGR